MSLRERRDVLALCRDAGETGGVLFTVVRVSGSSYRRPGARMVALSDGRTAGTLSGGCLEAELLRRAAWTVRNGAVVERFSTAFDDTADIPYGLGCGGDIDVLAEPLGTPEATALLDALEATLHGEPRTLMTSLPSVTNKASSRPFARVIFQRNDLRFVSEGLANGTAAHLMATRFDEASTNDLIGTLSSEVFAEQLVPAQRLVIFGAGEDIKPLVRLAAEMGFSVVVADGRSDRVRPDRFPQAEAVLFAQEASSVPVRSADVVVLMTHSYEQDRCLLTQLLPLAPRYLGLLGARHRAALLLNDASELSGVSLADAVERTHCPIGLGLGGDGPAAVSLAIIAEVQHVLCAPSGAVNTRRLNLAQAQALLRDEVCIAYPHGTCAVYAEASAA